LVNLTNIQNQIMKTQNQDKSTVMDVNRLEAFKEIEQASVTLDWILADDETACPSHIGALLDEASEKITVNLKKVESEHAALVAVAEAAKKILGTSDYLHPFCKEPVTQIGKDCKALQIALAQLAAVRGNADDGKAICPVCNQRVKRIGDGIALHPANPLSRRFACTFQGNLAAVREGGAK
jgi:hypothetical protein